MIPEFINAWDKNKSILEDYFKSHKQIEYSSYVGLVKIVMHVVLNPYFIEEFGYRYDTENVTIIDDGNYQGTQIFVFHKDVYQPGVGDYVFTSSYYGSCSLCDTMEGIRDLSDSDLPSEEQVREYMTLALHQIQGFKPLGG